MTATAVRQPESEDPTSARASEMVRLIRESFAVVAPEAAKVAQYFYAMLFTLDPETRDLFPANMQTQRSRLLGALVHIVQQVDRPDELMPFLQQLGRDHRKFGVIAKHFEGVGVALIAAVKKFAGSAWTDEIERAWADAYTTIARAMQDAAAADEGPAFWPAEVLSHERIGYDLAVIRVRTDHPMPVRPGQYVSVQTPQRPRLWRYLSPANVIGDDGVLEFHVRVVPDGWVSRGIVTHTNIGDVWRLGSPIGSLTVNHATAHKILMIAGGTGLSPMHAQLRSLAQQKHNAQVHLFYGARKYEELYELPNLRSLASTCPWLRVTAVVDDTECAAPGVEVGTLADVVTKHGAWTEHQVQVAGSPAMVRATVSSMLVAGTPLDQIHYDPFIAE